MISFLKVCLVVVLVGAAGVGAWHGHNQLVSMRADMAALKSAIEVNNTDAAGSIVMAHRAFVHNIDDLAQTINELAKNVEKLSQEHDHLHDNLTKVMIKANRVIVKLDKYLKLHPSHKRAN